MVYLISYLSDNTAKCRLVKTVPEGNILKITSCSIWTTRQSTQAQVFQILNLGTEDWHWKSWSFNSSISQSQSNLENLFGPRGSSMHIFFIPSHNTWYTVFFQTPQPTMIQSPWDLGILFRTQEFCLEFLLFCWFGAFCFGCFFWVFLGFFNRIYDSRLWSKQ